jgi:glycosyltransferase involved in cell wall biosynthesis
VSGYDAPILIFNDINVRVFKIEAKYRLIWLIKATLTLFKLKLSHAYNCDIICAYNHSFVNVMFAYIASKLLKKPLVIFVYHVEKYQLKNIKEGIRIAKSIYEFNLINALSVNLVWPIIRLILKYADAIIVPSNATANDLISLLIPQNHIYVIPLGLEHERPKYLAVGNHKKFDCIYMGRLTQNKGFLDALLAWKLVISKLPNAKLAIVGGEPSINIKNLINKNKLQENVIFLGFLDEKNLSDALYKSKLLLLPSHTEGFCFTVGKAILHNIPVIAYEIPAIQEIYGFLPSVIMVKEGDIRLLAKKIVNVLLNENFFVLHREMEKDGSELLHRYSWEKTAEEILKVFEKVNLVRSNFLDKYARGLQGPSQRAQAREHPELLHRYRQARKH